MRNGGEDSDAGLCGVNINGSREDMVIFRLPSLNCPSL